MVRSLLRGSLWLALVPTSLLSFLALFWGLRVDMWRLERPLYPVIMLLIAAFPVLIAYGLVRTNSEQSSKVLALYAGATWMVIVAYVAFTFGWLPQPIYDGWRQLV